ncbi:NADPH-dependent ferric siderophore reductase, contains FAD-binding and SIP domains [Micromonospora nigra]|uniref:NADPH-dependent ferric siderophore reductase, contains FAD-binding and SIP domains n=1 Tax=Micromonospora nigra TaxID=145857 RepID=A0A1C6RJL6_9ACTN|nr:siderophore-interacting protein [Micromonospora nigra]SCL17215.1 NADPH-dependent ferric siderophore reductase, contains FAD-binding and SIP domains [Micromonospora nigra]
MTERPKTVTTARVLRTGRPTPHVVRLVLGGDELVGLPVGEFTDHYIKIVFPVAGVDYPRPMDLAAIRRELPRAHWPRLRAYTVRAWDAAAGELTVDVVHHGDQGLAGPWAAALRPGDPVLFTGPGGAYAPSPTADWHLLVGDESALPAIAAALTRLPQGAPAHVFVEVADAADEQSLPSPGAVHLTWLHRGGRPVGEALVAAVRGLDFPAGDVHAFVHGEAAFVRELRRLLRVERGVPRDCLSISGYWRLGMDDEGWRATKPDWNRQVEADETPLATP